MDFPQQKVSGISNGNYYFQAKNLDFLRFCDEIQEKSWISERIDQNLSEFPNTFLVFVLDY